MLRMQTCSPILLRAHRLSVPDVQSGVEEDEEFEISFPGTKTKLLHSHSRRLNRMAEGINMHHIRSTGNDSIACLNYMYIYTLLLLLLFVLFV